MPKPRQAWTELPPYTTMFSQDPGRPGATAGVDPSSALPRHWPLGPNPWDPPHWRTRPAERGRCVLCRPSRGSIRTPGEGATPLLFLLLLRGLQGSCKFHLGLWALPSGDTNAACLPPCPECGFPALFWIALDPHRSTAMGGWHWNVPQPGWFTAARSLKDVSSSWLIFLSLFSLVLYLNITYCNILQNYSLESHTG